MVRDYGTSPFDDHEFALTRNFAILTPHCRERAVAVAASAVQHVGLLAEGREADDRCPAQGAAGRRDLDLVGENYSNTAILADVMMLCGAGMQTTREFISMAAWHLLEKDHLRAAFLAADYAGKMAILEEILRVDPIVSTLYRRAPEDLDDKAKAEFEPGKRYGVSIRHANHDPRLVGENPHAIDLARKEKLGDQAPMMSFGNGMHRCPGSPLALNETLFLLDRLLRVPGVRLASQPKIVWEPNISTFEISDVLVTCD